MTSLPTVVESARGLESQRVTGQFRCTLPDEAWWWSDETYVIHGFAPGEVVPTTALVKAHKHPDDWDRVRRIVVNGSRTGAPFRSVHRIMDARGRERTVVMLGQVLRDEITGQPALLQGYVTDLTDEIHNRAARDATHQIRSALASREVIDQAKGALVVLYDVSCDEAFEMLRATSNARNVKVRDLAQLVVATAREQGTLARESLDSFLVQPFPIE